jgi:hypothetical protein
MSFVNQAKKNIALESCGKDYNMLKSTNGQNIQKSVAFRYCYEYLLIKEVSNGN